MNALVIWLAESICAKQMRAVSLKMGPVWVLLLFHAYHCMVTFVILAGLFRPKRKEYSADTGQDKDIDASCHSRECPVNSFFNGQECEACAALAAPCDDCECEDFSDSAQENCKQSCLPSPPGSPAQEPAIEPVERLSEPEPEPEPEPLPLLPSQGNLHDTYINKTTCKAYRILLWWCIRTK